MKNEEVNDSGLSEYELRLELLSDKIKAADNTLECIGIGRRFVDYEKRRLLREKRRKQKCIFLCEYSVIIIGLILLCFLLVLIYI